MDSFLRIGLSNRDQFIKESIIRRLSENVKEIQFEFNNRSDLDDGLVWQECSASLCTTIEAIFLHGLKDSLIRQTMNVFAGSEVDRRPEPNFWPPLLLFSHKQTIQMISDFSQITTEIGSCRAWIRLSLNDSLLTSYLGNIRKNQSNLSSYYTRKAFLRDPDCMEMAESYLAGMEAIGCLFELPCNSSLLNQWTNYLPLQLAGLYTPPLRSCPITSGIDVASGLSIDVPSTPKPIQTNEIFSESISNSPFANHVNLQPIDTVDVESISDDDRICRIINDRNSTEPLSNLTDVELLKQQIASPILTRSNSVAASQSSDRLTYDRHSYNMLLAKHTANESTVNLTEIWERFESSLGLTQDLGILGDRVTSDKEATPDGELLDFEFLPKTDIGPFSLVELHEMVEQLCHIGRELGLDQQNFACKSCLNPLGVGFKMAHVCSFSGGYYCDECMSTDPLIIPARIIYNWDFKRYPVSKRAASFLIDYQYQPFIDLKLLNPLIYSAVTDMAVLQSLRIQLNFIRAYLYTCCDTVMERLQKLMWTKEYMYEHIHRYSIADLQLITGGRLAGQLQKAVQFGVEHVIGCTLCSQKGFICEICRTGKVLYPFDILTTFRCEQCEAVFHPDCLNVNKPCPKCDRKRCREIEILNDDLL